MNTVNIKVQNGGKIIIGDNQWSLKHAAIGNYNVLSLASPIIRNKWIVLTEDGLLHFAHPPMIHFDYLGVIGPMYDNLVLMLNVEMRYKLTRFLRHVGGDLLKTFYITFPCGIEVPIYERYEELYVLYNHMQDFFVRSDSYPKDALFCLAHPDCLLQHTNTYDIVLRDLRANDFRAEQFRDCFQDLPLFNSSYIEQPPMRINHYGDCQKPVFYLNDYNEYVFNLGAFRVISPVIVLRKYSFPVLSAYHLGVLQSFLSLVKKHQYS